ncbi:MAG TPA: hypothetical protein VJ805_02110 [Nitrospiraceae bacterium]|nr:hypothetical protein [Nitrospiraceae bacterium]
MSAGVAGVEKAGSIRASDFDLARRIMTVLNTFTAEEVANQLF